MVGLQVHVCIVHRYVPKYTGIYTMLYILYIVYTLYMLLYMLCIVYTYTVYVYVSSVQTIVTVWASHHK